MRAAEDAELSWLTLEEGVPTELTLMTDPHWVRIHSFIPSRGSHRNFACRETAPEGCFFCYQGHRAVPFGFVIVEAQGEYHLFQITRGLMRKVRDLSASQRLVVTKLNSNPWFRLEGQTWTTINPLPDEMKSIPERVARSMSSIGYLCEYGPAGVLDFLNSRKRGSE